MLHWKHNPIFGDYLIQLLEHSHNFPDWDYNSDISLGTQHFKSKDPLEQARWYRALGIYLQEAKSDIVGALEYYQRAYSLAESIGYPTIVGIQALASIGDILIVSGKPLTIASSCQPTSYMAILANLNIALIDITVAADSKIIRQNIDKAQSYLKCKDKHQTMQAFRCLGQIFSVQGDNETALSLFNVALDGFTLMDVHHWRADCMARIADILNNRGEAMKAVELWKAARPLFERSSQMKDILMIDGKLAEVDSAVVVEYEEELQQLSELHVPVSALEEEEEAEEDELAQGKGRKEVFA
ncbi:hypothetical protein C8J57DRAFT_1642638 [Mycena rebaudengoi]|nr:hypothetical protein C8J57DRAFT_1642638 [Mycena rebaudengoi]